MDRLRVVLEFILLLGMGALPLRAVVPGSPARLVLGPGHLLGTRLGHLAHV